MEGQSLLWLVLVACVTNARSLDSIVPSTLDPSVEEVKKLRSDRLGALHAQEYRRASHLSRRINDLTAGAAVLSDVRASPANISGASLGAISKSESRRGTTHTAPTKRGSGGGCPQRGSNLDEWPGAAHKFQSTSGVWTVPPLLVPKSGTTRKLKLLVSVANYGPKNKESMRVMDLLGSFAKICNYGVDIHILMHVTSTSWNDIEKDAPVCGRIGKAPKLSIVKHPDRGNPTAKSARGKRDDMFTGHHRKSWAQLWNRGETDYDWWMYIEHDIGITVENFIMLLHEFQRLNGTRFMPGLLRYENHAGRKHLVEMGNPGTSNPHAVCMRSSRTHRNPFVNRTLNIRGQAYVIPDNGYQAMYMLPKHMIGPLLEEKSWSEPCKLQDMTREIFSSYWLFRGAQGYIQGDQHIPFIKVVPLETLNSFLVNHIGDKYVQKEMHMKRDPRLTSDQLVQNAGYYATGELAPVNAAWKKLGFQPPTSGSVDGSPLLQLRGSNGTCFEQGADEVG